MKKTYQAVKFIYYENTTVDVLLGSDNVETMNFSIDWLNPNGGTM